MEPPKTTASAARIINNNCTTAISSPRSSLSSESVEVVQDSPIFSYISNRSPIKPVQAAPVAHCFPGHNSPPFIFASPQINAQGQSNLFKGPQFKQSSNVELSRQDDSHKDASTNADEKSYSHASVDVKLVAEKKHENDSLGHNQSGSPSGCVDEFLNDFVVMDCSELTNLANSNLKKSDDKPRTLNGSVDLKDSVSRFERKDNLTEIPSPAIVEHAKDVPKEKSSYDMKLKQPDSEKQSSLCTQNVCIVPVSCALQRQDYGHLELVAGSLQSASEGCGETIQALSNEPGEMAQVCSKAGKATQAISTEAVKDITLHDPKASQQHGTSKRCLQFEDVQLTEQISCILTPLGISTGLRSPAIKDSEVLGSPGNKSATSSNMQLSSTTQPVLSPLSNGNFGLRVSRSGIGLHLNSIVNAMPVNGSARASLKSDERGYVSVRGKKSASTMSCDVPKSIQAHSSLGKVAKDVSACTRDGWSESQNLLTGSSATSLSPRGVNNFNPLLFQPIEPQITPHDKREISSELADNVEEFNLSSPKRKRKKMMETGDGDGGKRCNCKKTKCLKLYCDCFAAGIYCAEPCACQDCFNRPDYEDTVFETRQQIESRNPLAFAPKIIQHTNEPLANRCGEEVAKFTPSSARHKRGCNCKKSMCLKKYCECYQANVGCSDGCRCEGCKNVYGRKEEYAMMNERSESSLDDKPELGATGYGSLQHELHCTHNLTLLTPSFQCPDNGKDTSKLRFVPGRFLQSPDSDLHFLAPYGKLQRSRDILNDYDMILQTRKDILEVVSLDDELDCGNSERRDNFTANCHAVGNIGHFSALSNPPSMAIDTSAPLCSGNGQVTSSGSLRWRGSPITPLTRLGGTNISQVLASTDKLYDIIEDETPEFLKETPTSVNCVKASSPNSKRVSTPNSQLQYVGSGPSAGLRTGRKFILQAVPSFPPLTPCIDSKGSTTQTTIHP